MALELVGAMLECFAASNGGRKVTLNLCGQRGVAWALNLLHTQKWKHLRSDRRGGWAVECLACICLSLCHLSSLFGVTWRGPRAWGKWGDVPQAAWHPLSSLCLPLLLAETLQGCAERSGQGQQHG